MGFGHERLAGAAIEYVDCAYHLCGGLKGQRNGGDVVREGERPIRGGPDRWRRASAVKPAFSAFHVPAPSVVLNTPPDVAALIGSMASIVGAEESRPRFAAVQLPAPSVLLKTPPSVAA